MKNRKSSTNPSGLSGNPFASLMDAQSILSAVAKTDLAQRGTKYFPLDRNRRTQKINTDAETILESCRNQMNRTGVRHAFLHAVAPLLGLQEQDLQYLKAPSQVDAPVDASRLKTFRDFLSVLPDKDSPITAGDLTLPSRLQKPETLVNNLLRVPFAIVSRSFYELRGGRQKPNVDLLLARLNSRSSKAMFQSTPTPQSLWPRLKIAQNFEALGLFK